MAKNLNWQTKAKDDETSLQKLRKIFELISKGKEYIIEKRKKNFQKIQQILDEDSHTLQDIYQEVGGKMEELEESRVISKDKIDSSIIPGIKFVDTRLGEFINEIKELKKDEDEIESKKKEKNKASKNREKERAEDLKNEIEQMEKELKEKKNEHSDFLVEYEKDRILNVKNALLVYIHSELAYHLSQMDELSKLYKNILDKNPMHDFDEFCNKFSIKKDDIDLGELNLGDFKPQLKEKKRDKKQQKSNSKIPVSSSSKDKSSLNKKTQKANIQDNDNEFDNMGDEI